MSRSRQGRSRIPILSWTDNIWRLNVRVKILTTQGLMRLMISRNLWINNHGLDDTCKVSPDSQYSKLVLASIKSPTWAGVSELQSTHSLLDCITHGCNSLPTSFSEMNQLIFHKKLIVCLWINNHFNYIPMWTLHRDRVFCPDDQFCYLFLSVHTRSAGSLTLFAHVLSSPVDVSKVIIITAPAPALAPATVRSYYHYHV